MATVTGRRWISVRVALPLAAAVGTALHAPQSPAQEQTAEPRVLEEITVTAQRREQSLQDVPIAISVLGSSDIERLNAADVRDLQFATPNLVVVSSNAVRLTVLVRKDEIAIQQLVGASQSGVGQAAVGAPPALPGPLLGVARELKICADTPDFGLQAVGMGQDRCRR
jgi:outer membrane receptor protein involved in Fe transport